MATTSTELIDLICHLGMVSFQLDQLRHRAPTLASADHLQEAHNQVCFALDALHADRNGGSHPEPGHHKVS